MKRYCLPLLLLAACTPDAPTAPPAPSAAQYRVFTDHSYPPFIMHGGDGTVSGFEYDILEAIAARQGFKLHYQAHPWKGLFANLDQGRADIISSGISITDERQQHMLFSDPYFETESALLAAKHVQNIKTFKKLNGITVSVQADTSQDQVARTAGAHAVYTDTTWQLIAAILKQKSDAALGDLGVMAYYAQRYQNDGLHLIRDPDAPKESLGFALKKDNLALQQKLNNGLKQIKQDGTYDTLYQKWFGQHRP